MKNVRFLILAFCVLAACTHYVNRTCINMSIYAMVKDDTDTASSTTESTETLESATVTWSRFANKTSLQVSKVIDDDRQDWDAQVQGTIIGAFFWTYLAAQLAARSIGLIIGFKWLIVFTFILSANICVFGRIF